MEAAVKAHSAQTLAAQFDLHTRLFNNVLDGITDAETQERARDTVNHVKWLAGHLTSTRFSMGARSLGRTLQPRPRHLRRRGLSVSRRDQSKVESHLGHDQRQPGASARRGARQSGSGQDTHRRRNPRRDADLFDASRGVPHRPDGPLAQVPGQGRHVVCLRNRSAQFH